MSYNKSSDAQFGELYINGVIECLTLERLSKIIPTGIYQVSLDFSPHLQYMCPHLKVPSRDLAAGGDAGIRIHIANFPAQLEGCICPGTTHNQDSISNSHFAFSQLMSKLDPQDPISVEIAEAPQMTDLAPVVS